MLRPGAVTLLAAIVIGGCAASAVSFPNATPGAPRTITALELRPNGAGPFPAVVLLHGCHGVLESTREWARWFRKRGYVALVVDSWTPRGIKEDCTRTSPEIPNTERFDDTVGALRYLRGLAHVDREAIGVIGWSNGGVFAIAVINGPSLERGQRRGVLVPAPGFRASVAVYPGGCSSLIRELVVQPLLVLIGSDDDWTLPGPCVEMVSAMKSRGADASIVVYPGAVHYFDVKGPRRGFLADVENTNLPGACCGATVGYDPAASVDAHQRIEEFFRYHLSAR